MTAKAKPSMISIILRAINALAGSKDMAIVVFIVMIVAIIVVPLPSFALDFLLTISISLSVLIILIALLVQNPTDLSAFPTLLLIIVVFRLSLNVATTKMILLNGHLGPENVSQIISSFGDFVVGGNYALGIIAFAILVIINFMVITKGATRVGEVQARFALDSLPGKQMAIDADLNAGLIDDKQAKIRRDKLQQEMSFYGAMDGSSKFVQNDAIAGIIITFVNIIGGILIGTIQHDMPISEATRTFTLLTIGDGLVGQLPALITSTATAILITRSNKTEDKNFAETAINQLVGDFKTLIIVGIILLIFALVPGLPTLSLGFVGLLFIYLGLVVKATYEDKTVMEMLFPNRASNKPRERASDTSSKKNKEQNQGGQKSEDTNASDEANSEDKVIDDLLKMEILELTLGYGLIKLTDKKQNGSLLDQIKYTRKAIAKQFGFVVPKIRMHDDLSLKPNQYKISLKGIIIDGGDIEPDKYMAFGRGMVDELEGPRFIEPAFKQEAIWISEDMKSEAIVAGYTVVDPSTVVATHLGEVIKRNAHEIITRQDVSELIAKIKESYPMLVEDVSKIDLGRILGVIKSLLKDKIPIKDMLTILEAIADNKPIIDDFDLLVMQVRRRLARVITNLYKDEKNVLHLMHLDSKSEGYINDRFINRGNTYQLVLNSDEQDIFVSALTVASNEMLTKGHIPVLVVQDMTRAEIANLLYKKSMSDKIAVIGYEEIDRNVTMEISTVVSMQI